MSKSMHKIKIQTSHKTDTGDKTWHFMYDGQNNLSCKVTIIAKGHEVPAGMHERDGYGSLLQLEGKCEP